jgi:EAL domain-containing protein (putative c-di-GMP-specific phosphodiesterase class I)
MTPAGELIALVVEDHDFQRQTVARMLRALGLLHVLEAADGKQALGLLRDGVQSALVDIVVCDLDMPEMDGMELLRHIGQARCATAVIISSSKERPLLASVEKMALAYGVWLLGVIEKPVTLAVLGELIARRELPRVSPRPHAVGEPSFGIDEILRGMRSEQFEAFYQPKAALSSGRTIGAEALARWRHPECGIVAPHAFIAALEQSGNIDALTFRMLYNAAVACSRWRLNGFDAAVSVNLSLVSLTDTTLADRVTAIVRSAGLAPRHMVLEITETATMTEIAPALENLARLRMRGFGLSIDDYGTGFASMQQLTRVPFTELKIDQSFVTDYADNPSSRAVVESSVEMARRLNLRSVAEGVETQSDWNALHALGCDIAQGYFIARPMEEQAFLAHISHADR